MNRAQFATTANAAIKEGRIARQALAEHHANRFLSGAPDFDPRTLTKLGNAGMKQFVQIVRTGAPGVECRRQDGHEQPATSSTALGLSTQGWTAQQRPEPNWTMRAMACGTLFGTAVFLCGVAALSTLPL